MHFRPVFLFPRCNSEALNNAGNKWMVALSEDEKRQPKCTTGSKCPTSLRHAEVCSYFDAVGIFQL